jgi:biopolymer transport protein ExbD
MGLRLPRRLDDEGGLALTPLIDMVFLTLIFFMLNATLSLNPAIQVDLPEAYTAQAVLEEEIVLTISQAGELYVGKNLVALERLSTELKKEMARLGSRKMILQADQNLPYRHLVEVMDLARLAGIEAVALVTVPKSLP